jgi:hypothetical protein
MPSAFGNIATNTTDSVLVAARAGNRVRVYGYDVVVGATAQSITFGSKGAGATTALTGLKAFGANGGIAKPYNPKGWFTTLPNEGLVATTTSGGSASGVDVMYDYIPN